MTERNGTDGSESGDGRDRSTGDQSSAGERSFAGDQPGWSTSHGALSDNLVFAAVDNPRRRFILTALREEDGEASIDELVDDVAAIERQVDAFDPDEDHAAILEEIYDSDLPELTDIGVVDLDESNGTVELGPYADELDLDDLTPDTD